MQYRQRVTWTTAIAMTCGLAAGSIADIHESHPDKTPAADSRAGLLGTFVTDGLGDEAGLEKGDPMLRFPGADSPVPSWDRSDPVIPDALRLAEHQTYYVYNGGPIAMTIDPTRIAARFTPDAAERAIDIAATTGVAVTDRYEVINGWVLMDVETDFADAASADAAATALLTSPDVEFASPVFDHPEIDGGWLVVTQDIMVRVREQFLGDAEATVTALAPEAAVFDVDFGGLPGAFRMRMAAGNGFDALALANRLAEDPRIAWAEPDVLATMDLHIIPNDPLFNDCWGLHNTGQFGCCSDMDVDGPESWDIITGDSSVRVLVMDTGSQQNHPDINQISGRDFTNGSSGGFGDGSPLGSCDWHGTSVAGCVTGRINNGIGAVGVAPGCTVRSARIGSQATNPCSSSFGSYSPSWVVNALNWGLNNGCIVSNASFGVGYSSAMEDTYDNTRSAGMIHFASSGNGGASSIGFPASVNSTNAVGALDINGSKAGFSNWGSGLDFSAPGVSVRTTDIQGSNGYSSGDYTWFGGTSAASPYAAGAAALVRSAFPTMSVASVESILKLGAMDLGSSGYDTFYGWGFINPWQSMCLPGPSNNFCAHGTEIVSWSYGPSPYHTGSATAILSELQEDCEFNGVGVSNTVWYLFYPPLDGTLDINTNGSEYDTVLSVFLGTCAGSWIIACDDDSGVGLQSQLTDVGVTGGLTLPYIIKVSDYNQSQGGGDLDFNFVFTPDGPTNDTCGDALLIGEGATEFSTIGASTDGVEHQFCDFCCGDLQIHNDIWFDFVAPCTGQLTVSTCGMADFDTKLAVYTEAAHIGWICQGGAPMSLQGCNDDSPGCSGFSSEVVIDCQQGIEYRIRLGGYNGASGTGVLTVDCEAAGCAPDFNGDNVVNAADLAVLLSEWGPCGGCQSDFDGNNQVNAADLATLLSNWGACP